MRTIVELSHNHKEVEYKDLFPTILPNDRKLILYDRYFIRKQVLDLNDIEKITFYPR